MKNLKKMSVAFAMIVTLGTVAAPSVGAYAATSCTSQTKSVCDFSSGALSYKITGNNTCTVTGLSAAGSNAKSCKIPSTVTCNGKKYKVTGVAKNAFAGCSKLKKITCGSSIKTTGSNCFGKATVCRK
ncbi:MAG: hypothetical protein E7256_01480 [Lachnospiraceae bacterium]|nr:hypothetical protein [Lachnospiraceae bacterium]